jgi:hypothetical protein
MSEEQLKPDIAKARQRTALPVNSELVLLYARIGHDIVLRQGEQGWGAKVISRAGRARYWNSTSGAVCTRAKGRR